MRGIEVRREGEEGGISKGRLDGLSESVVCFSYTILCVDCCELVHGGRRTNERTICKVRAGNFSDV